MSGFDKREEGFESKFAHDADLRFKAEARRNKLVGAWAAELMGLSGDEAEAYGAKGIEQSDHQIRRTMDEMLAKAVEEIQTKG